MKICGEGGGGVPAEDGLKMREAGAIVLRGYASGWCRISWNRPLPA
jgi:hypothetical protein